MVDHAQGNDVEIDANIRAQKSLGAKKLWQNGVCVDGGSKGDVALLVKQFFQNNSYKIVT